MTSLLRWGALAAALLLGACVSPAERPGAGTAPARRPSASTRPLTPAPATAAPGAAGAREAGVVAGPAVYTLPIDEAQAARALAAFRLSCPALRKRDDASGLTRAGDWNAACDAAVAAQPGEARSFFAQYFETAQVGDGKAFATGYYEPEIAGSRDRRRCCQVPIFGRPTDLVDVDLGQFSDSLKGKKIRGRVDGATFVPYYDRAAIEDGALGNRAPVLAWAADPIDLFFLQIQGSGRLRLPDGSMLRIGYATQNGRDYTGIGALMRQRGLLAPGQATMQGIVAWLRAHPAEGRALMRENKSFVFFRTLDTPPIGALGYPVTGGASVAADPRFIPLGAPVLLSLDRADANGIWIAQDTGGAIKGANRFDTYWGGGAQAEATAGGMSAHGTAFLLLPVGTLARLAAEGHNGKAPAKR
ncbi:murein transglycosylase A [Sphingomonas sp. NFR15]|uniref:murein transglycosylase A n=1 Tax=Sphingomonas sp. NFR15 TaxID=1566282 RepID=UPI000888EA5C|nr:membrane-bound lytic murein transglycosylase A [Sphingomonas sp. NFR15]